MDQYFHEDPDYSVLNAISARRDNMDDGSWELISKETE